MRYTFRIANLDCANCAAKIEKALQKEENFKKVSLNFMLKKVELESKEKEEVVRARIEEIALGIEDGVSVSSYEEAHTHEDEENKWMIPRLIGGAALLAIGVFTDQSIWIMVAYLLTGYDILWRAIKNISKGKIFDENFLMAIATIAAFAIKEYPEAVAVMLFYQVGEYLQHRAVHYSKKAIVELMDIRPDFARKIGKENKEELLDPSDINVGEYIEIRPGEKVPLDGVVASGSSYLDVSMLTGESLPQEVSKGTKVLSGSLNKEGVLTLEVTSLYKDSTVAKMIALVENASSKKSKAENFITKFAAWYTPIVVVLALSIAILGSLITGNINQWVYNSIIFLVISCPCALVVSIPLGFFGGIGASSRRGVLIKGGNYLERLCEIDTVVLDKTGTITQGNFKVSEVVAFGEYSKEEVLYLAAQIESYSNHPIAKSIVKATKDLNLEALRQKYSKESIQAYKELPGHGVSATIEGKEVIAGNDQWMQDKGLEVKTVFNQGSIVYLAIENQILGYILVSDQIKKDSQKAIARMKEQGIKEVIMLTGDREQVAKEIASQVGVDKVYARLLPEDKVTKVEELLEEGKKVAFIGDGINDAPVLARADVGIAMGGAGSDAAIEASDMVLMTDELSAMNEVIDIAKKTRKIVIQNIVFALGIKVIVMILGVLSLANMWLAVFADVGVSLLAVMNAMRILMGVKRR